MPRALAVSGTLALASIGVFVVSVPAIAQAPAPGFQIDLAGRGRAHLECFVNAGRLRCLNYSRARSPGRCDVGGDVPAVQLARRGRAQITFSCVDEGFHDWVRLRAGQTFRSGPFRCSARNARTSLRCSSTVSGRSFSIASNGRVQRG